MTWLPPVAKPRRGITDDLIVVSDTHCGSRVGLCAPGVTLDGGAVWPLTPIQQKIWAMWREFWDVVVPGWVENRPYSVLFNGDALDGNPHGSTDVVSANPNDQHLIALACLKPVVAAAKASGGRYYHNRGTEAHVGKQAHNEEALARELGAHPDSEGQHAHWEIRLRVGKHLIHATHHIGSTSSLAYESTAPHKAWVEMMTRCAADGIQPPDGIVRSHRHRMFEERPPFRGGNGLIIVTPAWQSWNAYVRRLGVNFSIPQFGGVHIRSGREVLYSRYQLWGVDPPEEF